MRIKELIAYGRKMLNENNIEDGNIIAKSLAKYILKMNDSELIINEDKEVEENARVRYYLSLIEIVRGGKCLKVFYLIFYITKILWMIYKYIKYKEIN